MEFLKFLKRYEKFVQRKGDRRYFFKELADLFLERVDCPIYYYHEVNNPQAFAGFVIDLLQNDRHPIRLDNLVTFLQTDEQSWPEDKKPFVLTFDDGLLSQKVNALPFLFDWKIPAVFAVMPDWQGDGRHRYMDNNDFRELVSLGMEVISHTFHHAHLPILRQQNWGAWAAEIVQSKSRLQDVIGVSVDFLCYPYGAYDRPTVDLVAENYLAALSTRSGSIQYRNELYYLRRERKS